MGIFRLGRHAPIEETNSQGTEPIDVIPEVDDYETTAINDLLARAATRNLMAEAGATFEAKLPRGLSVRAIDLIVAFAMRGNGDHPLPLAVTGDKAIFQATTTSAIVPRHTKR